MPVVSYQYGRVSAAVFANAVKTKDGRILDIPRLDLRRSYRNAKGDWESTHSLGVSDLLPAALALMKCYEHLASNGQPEEDTD